jgi:hypothetical protein
MLKHTISSINPVAPANTYSGPLTPVPICSSSGSAA